jgi:hypothetical protein
MSADTIRKLEGGAIVPTKKIKVKRERAILSTARSLRKKKESLLRIGESFLEVHDFTGLNLDVRMQREGKSFQIMLSLKKVNPCFLKVDMKRIHHFDQKMDMVGE